ncbi:hypothetical protein IE81DRAFT_157215 [Ceraceosorus guamensis]|uniref:CUE domain-containing protein n=1 Tax=Ceraceosorus guamensis TaxID=1522189 RepID=A0A316VW48_9BASI|nr:hypothetical protein IE81DRAFT_157215 [Ceraceosorus guamensis]PWN41720.1 hypothetical protein IE81DRAFT_157215 [Ceraceosorus guamensis]
MSEPESRLDLHALQDALDDQNKNQSRAEAAASSATATQLSKPEHGKASPETLSPSSPGSKSPARPTSSAPTAAPTASQSQQQHNAAPMNPQVEQIRSMFPDFDQDTVAAVLEAQGSDVERAVNALLSMSDPTYKAPPPASNEEADAAFARSLAQQQRAEYVSAQQQQQRPFHEGTGAVYDPSQLNYQPRLRRNPPSHTGAAAYHAPPPSGFENINRQQAPVGWPGPDDAKRWGDQINSAAEKGFAQASTAFSAIRQRLAQGTSPGGTPTGGSAAPSGRGGGGAASFFNSIAGGNSASATNGGRNARGNVKSPDQNYDRDPAQVGDADLAALLASNGAPKPPTKADRMLGNSAKNGSFDQRYGASAGGKMPNRHSVGRQVRPEDELEDAEELGWESAGRAPAPISIRDNSLGASGTPSTPVRDAKSSTGSNRDAVDRMESSTGRGLTSPKPKSPAASAVALGAGAGVGAAAGLGAAATAAHDDEPAKSKARSDDGSSDGEDLEYVSNPFDDED